MLLFTFYAALVWVLAARWRRTPAAFLVVLGGLIGLIIVAAIHYYVGRAYGFYLFAMQAILYPYTVLVIVTGLALACMPRRVVHACVTCGYSLEGLPVLGACPECGKNELSAKQQSQRRADHQHDDARTQDDQRVEAPPCRV